MYKRIIKKYSVIVSFLFVLPCLADSSHFTYDIVSHAMSSYLNDIATQKVKTLESQYNKHVALFKKNREREIEKKLKEKLAELNQFPPALKRKEVKLNKEIALYNRMLIQYKERIKKRDDIQDKLNKAIQKFNKLNESKQKVVSLVEQINKEAAAVNNYISKIDTLRKEVRASLGFYENKEYLSHGSIVQLKQNLREWQANKDEELELKITAYNNKVEEFEKWQQDQKKIIEEKRNQANLKVAELNQFVEAVNALIDEYNQERKKKCGTKQCERDLLNKKKQIEEKKVENTKRQGVVDQLVSDINQKEVDYNTEHARYTEALDILKEEIKQFSQLLSTERTKKEQELAERIRLQSREVRGKTEKAQELLDQLQVLLNTNYGGHFDQLVEYFSQWLNANRTLFDSLRTKSLSQPQMEQMQVANNTLCEYSSKYPSAVRAKMVCESITQMRRLLGEIYNSYSDILPEVWVKQFNEVEKEITDLKKRVAAKKRVNEQQKSQLDVQVKKYNSQLSEREAQYKLFSKQLTDELNVQLRQIHRAHRLKNTLLMKEYGLLRAILSQRDLKEVNALLSEARDNFLLALEEFMSSIPEMVFGFPVNFTQSNEIVFTVLEKDGWNMDSDQVIELSDVANTEGNHVKRVEEEEKKRIVFSWIKTPFMSDFLMFLQDWFSGVFDVADKSDIVVDKERMFIRLLFLKSVYRSIPVQQVAENNLIRYQITFGDRVFWILPEGKLELPEGVYQ